MGEKNGMASVLSVFGYIIIGLGIISGFYYGTSDSFDVLGALQGGLAWGVVLQGLIVGLLFLGISEIIFQLKKIASQEKTIQPITYTQTPNPVRSNTTAKQLTDVEISGPVSERVMDEIERFYAQKGIIVQYIKATAKEDIYYVKTGNSEDLVELKSGYQPFIKSEIKL